MKIMACPQTVQADPSGVLRAAPLTVFSARSCQLRRALTLAALLLLAACTTTKAPPSGKTRSGPAPSAERDGPEAKPPSELARVPDAVPQIEPIRTGGPNKPYEVLGRDYTPLRDDSPLTERGLASWYGKKFHGRRTASGEVYNMYAMTAAHKTMPIPSYARVRNPKNGREVIVRVNDRGPFHAGRVIDLSYTAAYKLGLLNGVAPVEVERITHAQIRSGAWRREGASGEAVADEAPRADVAPTAAALARSAVRPDDGLIASTAVGLPATTALAATRPALGEASGNAPSAADELGALPLPASGSRPSRAYTSAAQGFWVQLGAFKVRDGAEQFQQRVSDELDWLAPLLAVFSEPGVFRLQAGPYPSRAEAQSAAERMREALRLVPVIVERR
jgi:rare lipoprotein A